VQTRQLLTPSQQETTTLRIPTPRVASTTRDPFNDPNRYRIPSQQVTNCLNPTKKFYRTFFCDFFWRSLFSIIFSLFLLNFPSQQVAIMNLTENFI
jgi:hypothetical protein